MKIRLPYLVVTLVFAFSMRGSPPGQAPQTQQANPSGDRFTAGGQLRKPSTYSGSPIIGEFRGGQSESAAGREHRQIREQRLAESHAPRQIPPDPGLLVNGQQETTALRVIDYNVVGSPDPRGIPVSTSAAIVTGTIASGKCIINGEHTYVYTDYTVRVDQIIKQDPTTSLTIGDDVIASRTGGAIRYPSAHVTNILTAGHGLPAVGAQYVLFLWKPVPSFAEYEIIFDSGYQISNGRVYPLDDINSQYVGVELPAFLDEVNKALADSQRKGVGR